MKTKPKLKTIILLLVFIGLIVVIFSLCFGSVMISPIKLIKSIFSSENSVEKRIFLYSRLPRTCACFLAGAGLATAGGVLQGLLSNRLASPGIIGVNAGAGVGVTICCAIGAVSGWVIAGASFIGALLAVLTVTIIAQKTGASRSAVILGGVALNSFLTAISEAIITLIPDIGSFTSDFRTGGFSNVSSTRLIPAAIMIIVALIIVYSLSNELDILSMGEEIAQGLGVSVNKIRTIFLILAAILAGASVSFAGLLGFVGLIIPNMVKKIIGSESKKLLPMCGVFGAIFVTICDIIARVLFIPHEIPTGIIMAVLGAPFFFFLLFKSKGGHSYAQ